MNGALVAVENAEMLILEAKAWLVRAEGLRGSAFVEFQRCGQEAAKRARRILSEVDREIEEGLCVEPGGPGRSGL